MASPTRCVVRAMTSAGSGPAWWRCRSRSPTRTTAPVVGQQAVHPHPLVVVDLGQVVPAAVRQEDDDDRLVAARRRGQVADDLARGDHRRAARTAGQDALLARDPPRHRERVAVADADPAVDDGRVVGAREEVLAHALGQVRPSRVARQDAALRVGADDLDRRVPCLERVGGAGDRAAGPDAGDEMGDPPVGLVPQLGTGRPLVGRRVLGVPVLVGLERARDVAGEPARRPSSSSRATRARRWSGTGRPPRRTHAGAAASPMTACRP